MTTKISKAMTKNLVTIPLNATIGEADDLMESKRIRHLVVMDESGSEAVGIISKRTFVGTPELLDLPVEAIMSSPIHFVHEDTPLKQAIFTLLEQKISCLLIVNSDQQAIGIVTTDDLLWHLAEKLSDEKPESVPLLSAYSQHTIGLLANQIANTGI